SVGELLDVTHRGTLADEVPALPAQRVPGHERVRTTRTQAGRGLVHSFRGPRVAHRIRLVHDADEALEQQATDNQVGEADHQNPADRVGGAPPEPAVEQLREPAVQAVETA